MGRPRGDEDTAMVAGVDTDMDADVDVDVDIVAAAEDRENRQLLRKSPKNGLLLKFRNCFSFLMLAVQ